MANECATWCCTSATRDIKTVTSRVEHEGLSFLTITLPEFGKAFERALDQSQADLNLFSSFKSRGGLPQFLGGFLDRVFDRSSGSLLPEPCVDSIRSIRQLTLMFGKMELECTERRTRAAMQVYVQCEKEVKDADERRDPAFSQDFKTISAMLFARAFSVVDRKVYEGTLVPRHGPGATADRLRGNSKYRLRTWTARLEEYFPVGEYLLPNWRFYDQLDAFDLLEPGAEIPVRVVPVPKTLKTPRIIGIEPTCMQYAQQALLPEILTELKRDDNLRSFLGFDDQTPNQRMARAGSQYGNLATLDLSEASDRVSNQHVRDLLANHRHLLGAVDACRSRKADVPGEGCLSLSKFASMGSALCFPMEAMVFLTVVFLGIQSELNEPLTSKSLKTFRGKVRIYGDDIIVPVEYVRSVVQALQSFGFVVNLRKSFWTGKFRESCGRDYYDGHDVSVVRVRQEIPSQLKHATEVVSLVSFRNQMYFSGYWETCKLLDGWLSQILKSYPVVLPSSRVLGRHSFLGFDSEKTCPHLHSPLVKGHYLRPKIPTSKLEGSEALLKCLLLFEYSGTSREIPEYLSNSYMMPSVLGGKEHLERAGRPMSVNIKHGWVSPI